jgi:hypothetical protein
MAYPITLGKSQQGFGYLAVLFIALILAIYSGVAYERLDTIMRRDKEQEWLFVGKQYQQAIASYYNQPPDGVKVLPDSVDELVEDKRFLRAKHHLRKVYLDPMTGGSWLLLQNENHKIIGVGSNATTPVLQSAKLAELSESLGQSETISASTNYSEIKFIFVPSENVQDEESEELGSGMGIEKPTEDAE